MLRTQIAASGFLRGNISLESRETAIPEEAFGGDPSRTRGAQDDNLLVLLHASWSNKSRNREIPP